MSAFGPSQVPDQYHAVIVLGGIALIFVAVTWPLISKLLNSREKTDEYTLHEALKHIQKTKSKDWRSAAEDLGDALSAGRLEARGKWFSASEIDTNRRTIPSDEWRGLWFPPELTGERPLSFVQSTGKQGQYRNITLPRKSVHDLWK